MQEYQTELQQLAQLQNAVTSLITNYRFNEESEDFVNKEIEKFNSAKKEFEDKYNVIVDTPDIKYVGDVKKVTKSPNLNKVDIKDKEVSKDLSNKELRELLEEAIAIAKDAAQALKKEEQKNKQLVEDRLIAINALCEACKELIKFRPKEEVRELVVGYVNEARKKIKDEKKN